VTKYQVISLIAVAVSAASAGSVFAAERSPYASVDENPTTVTKAGVCQIKCVDPVFCCSESQKVIAEINEMAAAYTHGDLKAYEKYLDNGCTMFDEATHKLIAGKQATLEHLKESFAKHAPGGPDPLKGYTIDQPFAKVVKPDTCVVTFFATKEIGGEHPRKERAHVTDVFVKRGHEWKKLSWSGTWLPVTEK
jgi:ketosteroid isomerase-like protein